MSFVARNGGFKTGTVTAYAPPPAPPAPKPEPTIASLLADLESGEVYDEWGAEDALSDLIATTADLVVEKLAEADFAGRLDWLHDNGVSAERIAEALEDYLIEEEDDDDEEDWVW